MKNVGGVLLCVALSGCIASERQDDSATPAVARKSAETEQSRGAIEAAAIAEVARQTNVPPDRLDAHADRDRDQWCVLVELIPATRGEHYLLRMSNAGEVIEFLPGL